MKKIISFIVALMLAAMQMSGFAYAEENDAYSGYFADREELVVAALGGSITAAGGTTVSWGKYFSDWLSEETGKPVTFYNKGVGGTGSDFGIARVNEDISSLAPDVVIVEFSVNDRGVTNEVAEETTEANTVIKFNNETKKYELPVDEEGFEYVIYNGYKYTYRVNQMIVSQVKRDMEAITRQLLSLPKKPVIIYNYVGFGVTHIANTATDSNRIGRLIMPRAVKELHEEVAEKYGIPSIDIDSYIQNIMVNGAEALDGNKYTQNEIFSDTDCIHPNTTIGTRLYADFMIEAVKADADKYLSVPSTDVSEIEKYSNNIYSDTFHTMPYTESTITGTGWKETEYNGRRQIITEVTGDSASFEFEGNVIRIRGAHVGGSFNVEITNEDGTTLTETKSVGVNTSSAIDVLYTNAGLPDGKHTVTITRNTGKLAIHGISINGVMPEEGYKSEADFRNEYVDILEKAVGSFSCSFDDLKDDVVDAGWVKADTVDWEVVDGRLALTGGVNANDGACDGISIDVSQNESDIIYLGLDFINTVSTGIRIINGDTLSGNELFGMIYGNPAGVFIRDGQDKASRFKAEDKFWPEAGVEHRLELILNYKNNDFRMYLDGVEATYTNGTASTQGGVTIKGSSLNKLKIGLSGKTTTPIYIDNLDLMGYDDYLEGKIANFNIYGGNASEELVALKDRVAYLDNNNKPISAEAKAEILAIEEKLEAIANAESTLTPSDYNAELVGARQLYTFSCNGVSSVKVDGKELTKESDYLINENMIFFGADVFKETGKHSVEITDNDGNFFIDYLEVRNAETVYYPLYPNGKAADGVTFTGSPNASSPWIADSAYSKNANYVYQVYNSSTASATFAGREELKGTYEVEWYDISAIHSTNGIYAMPKLNLEVCDVNGVSNSVLNMNRDNSWKNLGQYTFSGSTDEYITVSNGIPVSISPGTRFFAEIIRFTECVDESVLWKEFLNLPENITISESDKNVAYTNVARIITLDEAISMDYVAEVLVNGVSVEFDVNGRKILIPETNFADAGEYTVKVKLTTGDFSQEISFSIEEAESTAYTWQAENAEVVTETNDVSTAGPGHSRSGLDAPLKIGKENAVIVPNGDKALDDAVYVKWTIEGIAEGDYLVDTWLPAGYLAKALKAEVVSNGGETKTIYRSIHNGSTKDGINCYTEGYFGNGAKIHFNGTGNEYIKIMLDDDYLANYGRFLLIDSIRLTPWYDMNSVYDEFYGDDVITMGDVNISEVEGTDAEGNKSMAYIAEIDVTGKYKMNKLGYNLYLAVYDSEGKLTNIIKKDNVSMYDGDKTSTVRINLTLAYVDTEGKTYRAFLWGSDLDSSNDTSMIPYVK